VRAIFILVREQYRPTEILEELKQKLGRLEPLSPIEMLINGPGIYRVAPKSKPLPNDQKIVLNRIKACQ